MFTIGFKFTSVGLFIKMKISVSGFKAFRFKYYLVIQSFPSLMPENIIQFFKLLSLAATTKEIFEYLSRKILKIFSRGAGREEWLGGMKKG